VQVNIPPIVPYVIGAVLILFGSVRIKYLAAPRSPRPAEDDDGSNEAQLLRGKEQKRHLRWGVIYILLGLFLFVSTYMQVRRGR
jgi:fucose permease